MKIAYILFDGITLLDFIGIYDPITRLKYHDFIPDLEWHTCSFTKNPKDSFGLTIPTDKVKKSLKDYDMIIIPGGYGTRDLENNPAFIKWLQTAKSTSYKVSICTGSLLLGAAGFLKGRKATTHFDEYENLAPYCALVEEARIVEDHNIITAGAVASSIDLGLYLCEKFAGSKATKIIQQRMNYRPEYMKITKYK